MKSADDWLKDYRLRVDLNKIIDASLCHFFAFYGLKKHDKEANILAREISDFLKGRNLSANVAVIALTHVLATAGAQTPGFIDYLESRKIPPSDDSEDG